MQLYVSDKYPQVYRLVLLHACYLAPLISGSLTPNLFFSLRHFGHCLIVVLKLAVYTLFEIFRHCDQTDLSFFFEETFGL